MACLSSPVVRRSNGRAGGAAPLTQRRGLVAGALAAVDLRPAVHKSALPVSVLAGACLMPAGGWLPKSDGYSLLKEAGSVMAGASESAESSLIKVGNSKTCP